MTKTIRLLVILLLSIHTLSAQKVPPVLTQAFAAQYPGAHVKRWTPIRDGYSAIFRQHNKKSEAFYTSSGTWMYTETKIKWTWKLPPPVKKAWDTSGYITWMIRGMKEQQTARQTLYIIHVAEIESLGPDDAKIGREFQLYFSPEGQLIRKERLKDW